MQQKRNFGRRPTADEPRRVSRPLIVKEIRTEEPPPVATAAVMNDDIPDVDREVREWNAARKQQRRQFREPWRTLSIVTTVGFGISFWLLPDSVANVVQYITGALALASFFAGLRGNWRRAPIPSSEKIEPTF